MKKVEKGDLPQLKRRQKPTTGDDVLLVSLSPVPPQYTPKDSPSEFEIDPTEKQMP